jgi:digeranylgeranylglycerophospholipid reductase
MEKRALKTEKRRDVLIIGGGPSGLRLAGRLAEKGLDVLVLEKKPRVGGNVVCTGIVGKEVFPSFGLDTDSVIQEIREARLVSPFGTAVTYRHSRPFACVVDREKLDSGIAASAVRAGAVLSLGSRADDISVEPGGVRVTVRTSGQESVRHTAAMAVIASGVDYGLQKRAGLSYPRTFLKGAQAEVPIAGRDLTTIFFGRSVAPGAFAWSVPAGDKARVGLLTRKDPRTLLRKLLHASSPSAAGDPGPAEIRTKAVAQGLLARTTGDRILSVGEAAGQIKTTTGGGISYGLLCADLAAEALRECFERSSFGASALAGYEARWRKAIQREILVGYYTRRMCSRLSDGQVEGLFHLAQTDGIIPIIRETADFDWHSGLIFALLQRLSFMKFFRTMKDTLGDGSLS